MEDTLKDYKIAVSYGWDTVIICSCGTVTERSTNDSGLKSCRKCQNDNIIRLSPSHSQIRRVTHGILETVEKDDRSFHIKKREINIKVDKIKKTLQYKAGALFEMKYSLRTKQMHIFKDGEPLPLSEHNIEMPFRGIEASVVLDAISTPANYPLFKFAYYTLGSRNYERVNKFGRAIQRLSKYPAMEIMAFSGFENNLGNFWRYGHWSQSKETQPHKIIGAPKYLIPYLKEMGSFTNYMVEKLVRYDQEVGGNNTKIALELMKEEATIDELHNVVDTLISLHWQGYRDIRRLILYLAREVKLQQGIASPREAAILLRDYARMNRELGTDYDKYPKSLKKDHDITMMNYKVGEDARTVEGFTNAVEEDEYKSLAYRKKDYSVVLPATPKDLIDEGSSLSHCVASYVKDVAKNKCKILFIRPTADTNSSLITVEVRENNIRQIRGFGNRKPNNEEMDFVQKWAEAKQLQISTH